MSCFVVIFAFMSVAFVALLVHTAYKWGHGDGYAGAMHDHGIEEERR